MENKVIIITGGSSGIGRALAFAFGRRGSKVVITGRRSDELRRATEALHGENITAMSLQGDVRLEKDNQRMAEETVRKFGQIDVLINNAGISMRALFEETDLSVIRELMEINFFGAVYATKYCLEEILKTKGSIVGISSVAGFRGLPARTGYSASKFALNGFLESLRTELLYRGVHVLTACPGFTASNIRKSALTAKGRIQGESPREEARMMTAEECANRIYAATVKRRRTLILTRQGKLAVAVNKWFPALADTMVYRVLAREADSPLKGKSADSGQ